MTKDYISAIDIKSMVEYLDDNFLEIDEVYYDALWKFLNDRGYIFAKLGDEMKLLSNDMEYDLEVDSGDYGEGIIITLDGEKWWFLTEDERESAFEKDFNDFYDDIGITGFNLEALNINRFVRSDWFQDALQESYQHYADDIENEPSSNDKYENRLEEEMADAGVDGVDDFIELMIDLAGDPIEWYKSDFGDDEFMEVVKKHNLVDTDKLREYVKDTDGITNSLSRYDGNEEYEHGVYYYRAN